MFRMVRNIFNKFKHIIIKNLYKFHILKTGFDLYVNFKMKCILAHIDDTFQLFIVKKEIFRNSLPKFVNPS